MASAVRLALAGAAALALLGCRDEPHARTEILLVVDSDLEVPAQLDQISVQVEGPQPGRVQTAFAELDDAPGGLPRSVALVHEGGPLGPLHARVEGKLGARPVLARDARLSFRSGQTVVLPMHLAARCLGVACGEQTCTERGCEPLEIDPGALAPYLGEEPRLARGDGGANSEDAAPPIDGDAGERGDGAADAGTIDASEGGPAPAGDAGACVPVPELCNVRDDDCDGRIDNGYDLFRDPNHCGSCSMRCTGSTRQCCGGTCRNNCN